MQTLKHQAQKLAMLRILPTLLFLFWGSSNADFEEIRKFQKASIKMEITGSNVAMVYKDGRLIYYHAQNSGKPGDRDIGPKTIFPIWSMTKPITIVAMMSLYEKGLIDFEDPVSKYIPEFADIQCIGEDRLYDCKNDLKIIHLLTHRAGYSYPFVPNHKGTASSIRYDDLKSFVEDVAKTPLPFEPGTQYLYGRNQAILGRSAEVGSEQTFFEYLKETIKQDHLSIPIHDHILSNLRQTGNPAPV